MQITFENDFCGFSNLHRCFLHIFPFPKIPSSLRLASRKYLLSKNDMCHPWTSKKLYCKREPYWFSSFWIYNLQKWHIKIVSIIVVRQGKMRQWVVYYTSPPSFIITFHNRWPNNFWDFSEFWLVDSLSWVLKRFSH